jgi:hypothetical protein
MEDDVEEKNMPPLTTPSAALVFMALFFAATLGIPMFFARHHHRVPK